MGALSLKKTLVLFSVYLAGECRITRLRDMLSKMTARFSGAELKNDLPVYLESLLQERWLCKRDGNIYALRDRFSYKNLKALSGIPAIRELLVFCEQHPGSLFDSHSMPKEFVDSVCLRCYEFALLEGNTAAAEKMMKIHQDLCRKRYYYCIQSSHLFPLQGAMDLMLYPAYCKELPQLPEDMQKHLFFTALLSMVCCGAPLPDWRKWHAENGNRENLLPFLLAAFWENDKAFIREHASESPEIELVCTGLAAMLEGNWALADKALTRYLNKNLENEPHTFLLVIIALLLFARGAYVTSSIGSMKTYGEAIYYEYIETINPLDAEERGEYMRAERERLSSILNAKNAMDDAYQKGEISSMEYFEYKDSYLDADRHDKVFVNVEEYVKYVDKKNTQLGIDGNVIYTTGYEKLFGLASDVFLYAALLVLCINVFAVEYSFGTSQGGFSQIMRAAKRGRTATFFSKLVAFSFVGALVAVIFRLYTYYCVSGKYVLPGLDATLYSIESFSSVSTDMTIGEFFAIDLCMQFFAGAFIAIVISLFSLFFKKILVIISAGILCIGIPEILVKTVLREFADSSILSMSAPLSLFTSSAKHALFGNDVSYLVAVCIGFAVLAVLLAAFGYVGFCKTRYPDSDRNKNNGGNRV
jgi:hypothetical protein